MESHPFTDAKFPVPWAELVPEQATIDIERAMKLAQENIDKIAHLKDDEINYESVFGALDKFDIELDQGNNYLDHLNSVHDNEKLRAVYKELNPKITEFYTKINLNPELWAVVKKAAAKCENADLSLTQKRYIEVTLFSFRLNGADLEPEKKAEFSDVNVELTKLTQQYKDNILDSTNAFELYVENPAELEGLPESSLSQAKDSAEKKGKPGQYLFTLQFPSRYPVMKYAKNEELRKKIWEGSCTIGKGGKFDNTELVHKILKLRNRKAQLLGFNSFADLTIKRRMAETGDKALSFVDDLHQKSYKQFLEECERIRQFKAKTVGDQNCEVLPWESSYYQEQLRQEQYNFDDECLRPYFAVDKVMRGVFSITSTLYGIDVHEKPTFYRANTSDPVPEGKIEVWHEDVKFYEVFDKETGEQIGAFYADWHPREDKRGGAWMHPFYSLNPTNPKNLGTICGNFQKASGGKPALLDHYEVETIFHEFGHLCHHLVSKTDIRSLAGTNVAWDFVELPSQFLENWTWEKQALDLFAKHYETGELIPQDIFDKMIAAKNYNSAIFMVRQLSFGKLDLELHHHTAQYENMSIEEVDDKVLEKYRVPCSVRSPSFLYNINHLFSSPVGYSAGYYSYKWAEVLDADAFTRFQKEGILNEKVGKEFRDKILIWGDSKPAGDLFRDFMGREPNVDALLVRSGIHQ
ncbi:Oligopeptidase A [Tritrichomonas foetus]|uniref:oligopeptidase A n=1 Tax=Tritrichomonas foetus TaxID=1144522 RepID=A0A1J4K6M7_9EUKA|nr:Oligopeptidase A [Tritrichomonas foetus]|eukprot:OHT06626.1 Oligopeptidase A [Tritrichomonas foetus]